MMLKYRSTAALAFHWPTPVYEAIPVAYLAMGVLTPIF